MNTKKIEPANATKAQIANAARALFPGVKLQVVRVASLTDADKYVVESNDGQVLAGPCYHLDDLYAQVSEKKIEALEAVATETTPVATETNPEKIHKALNISGTSRVSSRKNVEAWAARAKASNDLQDLANFEIVRVMRESRKGLSVEAKSVVLAPDASETAATTKNADAAAARKSRRKGIGLASVGASAE